MKTLAQALNESLELFERYTDKDDIIVKTLSKYDMYLIGGTAINLWCNKLHLAKARSRSNNDLDFYTKSSNKSGIQKAIEYLETEGFTDLDKNSFIIHAVNNDHTIEVDILIDAENLPKSMFMKHAGVSVMSPVYLFASKFDRYINSFDSQRKKTDEIDLLQLLKIISIMDMVDELEQMLQTRNYDAAAERKLNSLIDRMN